MNKKYLALALMGVVIAAADARAEGKNGVAAVVNGKDVTVASMRDAYNSNPAIKNKASFDEFYKKTLDVFVDGELVYQAAVKENIQDTPEYKTQLKLAEQELARKIYLEKKVASQVSDAEVKKLYQEYKTKFKSEKEVKAKHILVDSEAKAKEVIAKLKKGGNFDKLAKEYSKEPADLGYFSKKVMVPEFSEAAFAMKKGEYSKTPVKTQFGYHVIKVEDVRDSKPAGLKEVEPQLKAMVTQASLAKTFQELGKNAKVTKYDLKGNVIE